MARGEAAIFGHNQFWIFETELLPDPDTWDPSNGLAVTAEHGAVILTSEYMGDVQVTVDARQERPAEADDPNGLCDGRNWDDIVEISVTCVTGPMRVLPVEGDVDLPRLDTRGPGGYRLRIHARNRDVPILDDEGLESSTDEYLIVSWPAPSGHSLSIRLTDQRGIGTRWSHAQYLDRNHSAIERPRPTARAKPGPVRSQ